MAGRPGKLSPEEEMLRDKCSPKSRIWRVSVATAKATMKGKSFHLVSSAKEVRRRWRHADPEEMRKLLAGGLEPGRATAVRRHLRRCLDCALLAGRLAAIQGTDLERTS